MQQVAVGTAPGCHHCSLFHGCQACIHVCETDTRRTVMQAVVSNLLEDFVRLWTSDVTRSQSTQGRRAHPLTRLSMSDMTGAAHVLS